MRSAVDPVVALPVLIGERGVGRRGPGIAGRVAVGRAGRNFRVQHGPIRVDRLRQQRQGHRRTQNRSRDHRIRKRIGLVLPNDFVDRHRGASVGRIHILQQHPRQGGVVKARHRPQRQIQIIAQSVTAPPQH